jgi:hypothetical protein
MVTCSYAITNLGYLDMRFYLDQARLVNQLGEETFSSEFGLGDLYREQVPFMIDQIIPTGKTILGKHMFNVPEASGMHFPLLAFNYRTTKATYNDGYKFDSSIKFRDIVIPSSATSGTIKPSKNTTYKPRNYLPPSRVMPTFFTLFQNDLKFDFLGCKREYETLRCTSRITNLRAVDRKVGLRSGLFISTDGQEFKAESPCCSLLGSSVWNPSIALLVTDVPLLGVHIFRPIPKNITGGALYSLRYRIDVPNDVDVNGEIRFSDIQLLKP